MRSLAFLAALWPLALAQKPAPQADADRILAAKCGACHGGNEKQGGLSLEGKLSPGRWKSVLARVKGEGGKPTMPLGAPALTPGEIATLEKSAAQTSSMNATHWAYRPVVRPLEPPVDASGIDSFVLAKLEREGLTFSPEADKTTLIRRVTLDLTGLPPTPEEVDAFVSDKSPSAYEKVVDRLLASPHFGEKLALPWLDAARYADSNGFQQDGDTYQWVWRDWVVNALNANMPFDKFAIEQLAGDLLPSPTLDQQIATGFNRNHLLNGEGGAIPEEQRNVLLFDRVDVTATTFLGLTVACAQCHDHKYDPVTQKDYYRFLAFFNNVPETGTPPGGGQYRIADPWIYAGEKADLDRLDALNARLKTCPESEKSLWTRERDALQKSLPRVMVMSDAQPRKTHVMERGNYEAPRDEVAPGTPEFLSPDRSFLAFAPAGRGLGGQNRLALARWLVSPENPLTARVQVNRYWQLLFGVGLVKTSENFGVQAEPPSHPELLDYLASEFQSDWNVKRFLKLLVTSRTYRQSSKVSPALLAKDPENRLLARGPRFRLPSLILRDVALASSGLWNERIGGKPVYPYQPKGIWDSLAITKERDFTYPQSMGSDLYRRSLYTFWRRTVGPGNMFDASSRQACKVRASLTSTPLHALTTLNDPTWVEAGRALAQSVLRGPFPTPESRLSEAFRRVCARRPKPAELAILRRSLDRAQKTYRESPALAKAYLSTGESKRDEKLDPAEHAAYASVCLSIYNLDEALTKE